MASFISLIKIYTKAIYFKHFLLLSFHDLLLNMGVKGKLIASMEVNCGGHSVHNIIHANTHHLPNISPCRLKKIDIHEGENEKIDSIVNWRYIQSNIYFSFFFSLTII